MPPRNSQREENHEIHKTHENWKYSNNSYGNNLIIYSHRLAGQANGDRGGPPTNSGSRSLKILSCVSCISWFHLPILPRPTPAGARPGSTPPWNQGGPPCS